MTAIEFVKEHGINNAKTHLSNILSVQIDDYIQDYINDLKQIVEAFDLVELKGGLISAKKYLKFLQSSVDIGLYHGLDDVNYETEIPLIKQAINLVEKCQND